MDNFECDFTDCLFATNNKNKLIEHQLSQHKVVNLSPISNLKTNSNTSLDNTKNKKEIFKCPKKYCKKRFDTSLQLEIHNNIPHKNFHCRWPECEKSYRTRSHLKWHMNSHQNKRPFKCTYSDCNKAFCSQTTLRSHIRQFLAVMDKLLIIQRISLIFVNTSDVISHTKLLAN